MGMRWLWKNLISASEFLNTFHLNTFLQHTKRWLRGFNFARRYLMRGDKEMLSGIAHLETNLLCLSLLEALNSLVLYCFYILFNLLFNLLTLTPRLINQSKHFLKLYLIFHAKNAFGTIPPMEKTKGVCVLHTPFVALEPVYPLNPVFPSYTHWIIALSCLLLAKYQNLT